jgi:hypothetical protein
VRDADARKILLTTPRVGESVSQRQRRPGINIIFQSLMG